MTIPTLIAEVAFSAASTSDYWHIGDSARGRIGTAAIGPDDRLWVPITPYVLSVRTRRGASRAEGPTLRYEAGSAVLQLKNSDRRFDPTNLAGPYVVAGQSQVEPMRAVRIRAVHGGITYPIWRGSAQSWQIEYNGPTSSTCTLTCTGGVNILTAYDRPAADPIGGGEDSGTRVDRILTSADWPAADRVILPGDSTLQETDLSGRAWDELLRVQDSELGELYIDADGRVVFRNRHSVLEDSRSNTSQATFGDDRPGGEIPYQRITPEYNDATIANLIRVTREGGTEQIAEDPASRAKYLTRTWKAPTNLLLETDAEALSYARHVLHQGRLPEFRFAKIEINPRISEDEENDLFHEVLGREYGERITVVRRPPGGGDSIIRDSFIREIEHEIEPGLSWKTVFGLQAVSVREFWTIGHSTLGQIGTNNAIAF